MHRQLVGSEQQFGGEQNKGVFAPVEQVSQDQLNEMIEEQGRCVSDTAPDQIEIGSLQCPLSQKPVTKGDHQLPVLSGIIIAYRRNLCAGYAPAGGRAQARIQVLLRGTGLGRRKQFRSREVDLEKLIGHQ